MTLTRMMVLVAAVVLFVDYEFGKSRLIQSISDQTTQLGYTLSNHLSAIARRVSR
jgi:hypothetical protein